MNKLLLSLFTLAFTTPLFAAESPKKWNIVLIGAEDISPSLGCYGDKDAVTPNLDKLAAQGAMFTRCFTHAPVCAPSRSGMITGMYPTTIGSHHMRSTLKPPRRRSRKNCRRRVTRSTGLRARWARPTGTSRCRKGPSPTRRTG